MKKNLHLLTAALLLLLTFNACKKDDLKGGRPHPNNGGFADNEMVMYWNAKVNTVLGAPMNQPTRARLYAMMQIAVHDALNSIVPKYERYALTDVREQFASPDAAVASAAYHVIKGLNRQGTFPIDDWYNESLVNEPLGEARMLGEELGKKAADAIIAKRANDGFSEVILFATTPANGTTPGTYRQTNVNNVRFLPNWGTVVQPFALQNNEQFRPAGPHPVTSPEYAVEYNEVKMKGARVNSTRTEEETALARFWAENRPSILWNDLVRGVIAERKMDAWKTARLFAIVHTSMADVITSGLNAAYHFYYWRPESAIHEGAADNNEATSADPDWLPFLTEVTNTANPLGHFVSPPQPEYPSAFTMYGGAVLGSLLSFFDEGGPFGLDDLRISVNLASASSGTSRHYTSLRQAVVDNSLSKIYAGWNFRKSAVDGQEMGQKIAEYVFTNYFEEE